jgi:hydrogenase maturation protein HypF
VASQHPRLHVVLSGGCFRNRLLTERVLDALRDRRVHRHQTIPPGDGGLAAGQLAVALAQIASG